MLLINLERGGIQGRTAAAWTVCERPGVFLCATHGLTQGPPRLQPPRREASVRLSQLEPQFTSEVPSLDSVQQWDSEGPRPTATCLVHSERRLEINLLSVREPGPAAATALSCRTAAGPNPSMHTDKYGHFNRSKWGLGILFL